MVTVLDCDSMRSCYLLLGTGYSDKALLYCSGTGDDPSLFHVSATHVELL